MATAVRMCISATSAGEQQVSAEKIERSMEMIGDSEVDCIFNLLLFHPLDPSTTMKKTPSCAMPVVSANMPDLTSCYMLNHAVQWIPLRMRKTGKR